MKKLLILTGLFALLVVGAFFVLSFFLGQIVTAGVNSFAPRVTQTRVVLGGARISPLSGTGTLSDLVVGNPAGWSDNNLCALGRIHLDVAPLSLLGDAVVVNEISIEAPEFNYETKIIASNVNDLLKNIEASLGGGKAATAEPKAAGGSNKKFIVKKFRLQNGRVRLGLAGTGATLPMPPIELNDLGVKEGGITANQLAFAVMKSVTASVVSATAKAATDIGKTGGAGAAETVKQVGDTIKGLFGGKK